MQCQCSPPETPRETAVADGPVGARRHHRDRLCRLAPPSAHGRRPGQQADRPCSVHARPGQVAGSQVAAHQLTQDQALAQIRDDIHAMHFDGSTGYVVHRRWTTICCMAPPALEGKPCTVVDETASGLPSSSGSAGSTDGGTCPTCFPSRGRRSRPKVTYVARFAPWRRCSAAGAYTDDLDAAFRAVAAASGPDRRRHPAAHAARGLAGQPGHHRLARRAEDGDGSAGEGRPCGRGPRHGPAATRSAAWPARCWCSRTA